MRILVSGSRDYRDYDTVRDAVESAAGSHLDVVVVHGAARGADTLGGLAAEEYGFTVEAYPADWSTKNAGPIRNSEMLSKNIDIALFFFHSGSANVGTRDAAKKAVALGIESRYYIDNKELPLSVVKRLIRPF